MRNIAYVVVVFVAASIMSCNNGASTKDNSNSSEIDKSADSKNYVEIVLDAYVCGDNCYLEYYENTPNATKKTALCLAKECGKWESSGTLPSELKNTIALVTFSTAKQYDGAGNVMDENYPAITQIKLTEGKAQKTSSSDAVMLSENTQKLQGTWKRQSYPNGTIEFKGKQVKFTTGEGNANPPKFQNFKLTARCSSNTSLSQDAYDFGLGTDNGNCEPIKMEGDSFKIYYAGSSSGVIYKKIVGS